LLLLVNKQTPLLGTILSLFAHFVNSSDIRFVPAASAAQQLRLPLICGPAASSPVRQRAKSAAERPAGRLKPLPSQSGAERNGAEKKILRPATGFRGRNANNKIIN